MPRVDCTARQWRSAGKIPLTIGQVNVHDYSESNRNVGGTLTVELWDITGDTYQ